MKRFRLIFLLTALSATASTFVSCASTVDSSSTGPTTGFAPMPSGIYPSYGSTLDRQIAIQEAQSRVMRSLIPC
ncbi:MAG: hypothetical protein IT576_16475 [Verrucomicrobiales bacterium]|nr:hypothetical protein [Verrucomicrobiales bacterium]